MISLIELCIKGELFFFENTLSEDALNTIAETARNFFKNEDACVSAFLETLYKKYSIEISLARIEKVIAV